MLPSSHWEIFTHIGNICLKVDEFQPGQCDIMLPALMAGVNALWHTVYVLWLGL